MNNIIILVFAAALFALIVFALISAITKRLKDSKPAQRVAFALMGALFLSPTFSIDIDAVLEQAFNWVNQLMPVYAVPLGITLGLGILGMLYALLSKAFKRGGSV